MRATLRALRAAMRRSRPTPAEKISLSLRDLVLFMDPARPVAVKYRNYRRPSRQLQDDLIAAIGRLSPEDRLKAFLAHCRLVTELYEAGRRHRARPSQPAES